MDSPTVDSPTVERTVVTALDEDLQVEDLQVEDLQVEDLQVYDAEVGAAEENLLEKGGGEAEVGAGEQNLLEKGGGEAEVGAGEENPLEKGSGVNEDERMVVSSGGGGSEYRAKRKRGRPRKQWDETRLAFMALPEFPASLQKRPRGRPRGSGRWQMLAASLGESWSPRHTVRRARDTGGTNFSPQLISIERGENIVERIWSFSRTTSDSICILSAAGAISCAEIFVPGASRGGVLRYQGEFSIVSLNGSHTHDEQRGGKNCMLSVQLAFPDGRLFGGAVAASLIAAAPTQLAIATFRQRLTPQPGVCFTSPNPNNNGRVAENGAARQATTPPRGDREMGFDGPNGPNAIQSAQPLDW